MHHETVINIDLLSRNLAANLAAHELLSKVRGVILDTKDLSLVTKMLQLKFHLEIEL